MNEPKLSEKAIEIYTQAKKVSDKGNCDVFLLNSGLERGVDNKFILEIRKHKQKDNLILLLVTPGGDADAAYRIARCAQDQYKKFTIFVTGFCKSAGTLCVLGAQEIVMSDQAELGPLDVQLYKKDELGELSSGLVIGEALQRLQTHALSMFEEYFLEIKRRSGGQVTFKTATDIATKLVTGLFEPVYCQIDPTLIGDIGRSMTIAKDYGNRLLVKSQNFSIETLDMLVESYPSHGFVIDRREAENLFNNVREPSDDEEKLARLLAPKSRVPVKDNEHLFDFLYPNAAIERLLKESTNEPKQNESDSRKGEPSANIGAGSDGSDSSGAARKEDIIPAKKRASTRKRVSKKPT